MVQQNDPTRRLALFDARLGRELLKRKLVSQLPVFELTLLPNATLRVLKLRLLKKKAEIVDVLAFPNRDFPNPAVRGKYLGEVYVNRAIAMRDFPRAAFLVTHGVLHLLGYRHARKHDTIVMEGLEQKLLAALL